MFEWIPVTTFNGYQFYVHRINNHMYVLAESRQVKLSLTNNIEAVIEHMLSGLKIGQDRGRLDDVDFYQYTNGEGLFRIHYKVNTKVTRDWPPFKVEGPQWEFIAEDLTAFKILYGL